MGRRIMAVCGASGRQGGAVARTLLAEGSWQVRAITRKPGSKALRPLAARGAEVVGADMEDPESLRRAFGGAEAVYSVQNGMKSGFDREVVQGRNVADAAKAVGVSHLVYGSAGPGRPGTGVPSWESKLRVEQHMREIGLPFTSLRPQAFMELMTDPGYYPAFGTWRLFPELTGEDTPIPWLAVADLGPITSAVLSDPDRFVGEDLVLVGDVQTLATCRELYRGSLGRSPRSLPMPRWLFDRFTRGDVLTMWRWLRNGELEHDTGPTRAIHPSALTVETWLDELARNREQTQLGGREEMSA